MNGGTKTFQFKPARSKPEQSYFITDTQIELENKDGSDTIVRFDSITSLLYADTAVREYKFRKLDIGYGDENQMCIGLTSTLSSKANDDEDLAEFYNLIHAFCNRIGAARPDLSVTIGVTSRANWIYFAVGLVTILGAFGILLGAYLSGVSEEKLEHVLLPVIILAGFGSYICFTAKPFIKRPKLDMGQFRRVIEDLLKS
jgi:hypothetical protein